MKCNMCCMKGYRVFFSPCYLLSVMEFCWMAVDYTSGHCQINVDIKKKGGVLRFVFLSPLFVAVVI